MLLPHNTDVARPRAVNTFLDGLAQLGVDKRLIKNNSQQQEPENGSDPEVESGNEVENSDDQVEHSASEILTKEAAPCHHCESSNVSPSVVVKCPICLWLDNQEICPICSHKIPMDRKHVKDMFTRCYDCGSVKHIRMRNSSFYSPSDNEGESD